MTQMTETDTRELNIESAYVCFSKHGLQKTTIVDIAKAANVSRSTVYEYFSDKGAVLEACAEHASEQFGRHRGGRPVEERARQCPAFGGQAAAHTASRCTRSRSSAS